MIETVRYARENQVPYFGLCLGMQVMVIEAARNLLGKPDANSTEFDANTQHPVIDLMPDQRVPSQIWGEPCDLASTRAALFRLYRPAGIRGLRGR